MFRPLAAFIGLRYSRTKRRNGFISFISASSTIGIALGVMVLIIGLSAMNGFEYELKNRILAVVPNAELERVNQPIDNWQQYESDLLSIPEVEGVSPFIKLNGLLQKGTVQKALQLRAVDSTREKLVSSAYRYVEEGSWDSLESQSRAIVLGKGIVSKLQLNLGDSVTVLVARDHNTAFKAPRRLKFTLTGIIHLSGQLDNNLAFIRLTDAQQLQSMPGSVDGIGLKVTDIFKANQTVREAGGLLNHYLYVRSWMTSQGFLYQDIQMVKSLMYIILILVIAVACFNIVTTLVMAVNDKRADIAILKTMGASNALLRTIFVVHGAVNGILGVVSGTVLGIIVSENLTAIIRFIEGQLGSHFLSGDIYFIDFLPSRLEIVDVAVVSLVAISMSILATVYPANQACGIQPARELGNK